MINIEELKFVLKIAKENNIPFFILGNGTNILVKDEDQLKKFVEEVGFPIFIKPDKGVGASNTTKINNASRVLKSTKSSSTIKSPRLR